MKFTLSHIEELEKAGKIRGFRISPKSNKGERKRFFKKVGKQKYWIEMQLVQWCHEKGFRLVPEYQFASNRKFRFDFAIDPEGLKIAIEYEGIFSEKSRHTTFSGYSRDAEKYNLASTLGFRLYRYTAANYKKLIDDLNELIAKNKN